uniref:TIR domain-containing protein n=1 Tax=Ciona savignyi TaxID=51511 RepID=H2Y4T5_CIOSA
TRTLDLSNNLISSIHNDSFGCFVALERLHLQLNNIDILFRWVFRGLAKLKVLNLSANSLVQVPQQSIGGLPRLESLDLSANPLHDFTVGDYTFSNVAGLRRIDLSHNKLASVHSAAFSDVPSLREIDLSNNNLQRVPFLLRSSTPRTVDRISLAWNKILDDTLSFDITATTEQVSLYNQARYVDLAGNWFTSFRSGEIDTALEGINVSHCKIQDLEKGSLPLLTNITLRTLDLIDGIQRGLNAGMFSGLKVKFLFLSKCNIRQISSSAFNGSTHMKVIDLSWNKISMIPGSLFRHNPMLEVINLRGNRISQMEPAAFAFLAHLRSLDVQNNHLPRGRLPTVGVLDMTGNSVTTCADLSTTVRRIRIRYTTINTVGGYTFSDVAGLRRIDLSHNKLASVHSAAFSDVPSLREIDLSNNNLQRVPLNAGMFSGLKVKFLFLSKCNIRQISSSAFNGSTHMKVIDLSWNKISMIPGSLFRHNPMLEVINLRGNRISQMEPAAFAFLAHLRSLDVQNNRFLCDCDIVPLQQWIIENTYTTARHRRRILFENATCFQQSSHAYLEMLRWDAGKQCWMKSTVVTGIAFASVLLVVCCVAFAYSSRFQALFWYEMVKAKISYRRKVPADAFGGNEYNAYISCVPDSNDEAWVVRHLLSAIENPPYELEPMKLCFPSRDFRPGRPKTASAASGIRSAERTLVILSAGYARCSW